MKDPSNPNISVEQPDLNSFFFMTNALSICNYKMLIVQLISEPSCRNVFLGLIWDKSHSQCLFNSPNYGRYPSIKIKGDRCLKTVVLTHFPPHVHSVHQGFHFVTLTSLGRLLNHYIKSIYCHSINKQQTLLQMCFWFLVFQLKLEKSLLGCGVLGIWLILIPHVICCEASDRSV